MRNFRSFVLWFFGVITFAISGTLFILFSLVLPQNYLFRVARVLCRVILTTIGQRIKVSGSIPNLSMGPYIYMFNHTSLLDTFIMIATLPEFVAAVGKREQFQVPLWGWILRNWGAVPIDRSNLARAKESLNVVQDALHKGRSLLIAPEGTRSRDGNLGPLKKGPFHLSINTHSSIVPVHIHGAFAAKNRNSWLLTPKTITVHYGSCIKPDTQSLESLLTRVSESLSSKCTS
ncbi:MAG: lysophospholipid acyltransferase family protein [Myxococcota bacterium]|nr:lysophospholipid acyltransferase family protein [Myxococcota bacterium]